VHVVEIDLQIVLIVTVSGHQFVNGWRKMYSRFRDVVAVAVHTRECYAMHANLYFVVGRLPMKNYIFVDTIFVCAGIQAPSIRKARGKSHKIPSQIYGCAWAAGKRKLIFAIQ